MLSTAAPFLIIALTLLIAVVGYLVKESISQGKLSVGFERDIRALVEGHKELKGALKYYLESVGKGAAILLDTPNPTPPDMQVLLRKHVDGTLDDDERARLTVWLRSVYRDDHLTRSERSAAVTLLASIEAIKRLSAKA